MAQDAELVAGMVRGEPGAFAELYEKYRTRLHQYALSLVRSRMEAEDVVHDVFIGLARQVGGGHSPREVSAYLYTSVRNRCMDRLRRKPARSLDDVELELLVAPAWDEARGELRRLLTRSSSCRRNKRRWWCCAPGTTSSSPRSPRCKARRSTRRSRATSTVSAS